MQKWLVDYCGRSISERKKTPTFFNTSRLLTKDVERPTSWCKGHLRIKCENVGCIIA
jgi:hypothetical protein